MSGCIVQMIFTLILVACFISIGTLDHPSPLIWIVAALAFSQVGTAVAIRAAQVEDLRSRIEKLEKERQQ